MGKRIHDDQKWGFVYDTEDLNLHLLNPSLARIFIPVLRENNNGTCWLEIQDLGESCKYGWAHLRGMKQFHAMTKVTSKVLLHDLGSPLIKLPEKVLRRENRKLLITSEVLTPNWTGRWGQSEAVLLERVSWFWNLEDRSWGRLRTEGLCAPGGAATFESSTQGPLQAPKGRHIVAFFWPTEG